VTKKVGKQLAEAFGEFLLHMPTTQVLHACVLKRNGDVGLKMVNRNLKQ
jgi:hypothetical protein